MSNAKGDFMGLFKGGTAIEVASGSGMLRVTVWPRPSQLEVLAEITAASVCAVVFNRSWATMPWLFRVILVWVFMGGLLAMFYRLSGTHKIEFDSRGVTVIKEVHGWERRREYPLKDCSELEWVEGSEGAASGMKCKVGWKTLTLGDHLSEEQAFEILTALQHALPHVAQKLCSYPGGKEHFVTLGLNK